MSVIGPRPALWNQDVLIAEREKYNANDVKPGLTGWAQINGRDELEIPVKAKLDGEYVEKESLFFDIKCFLGTIGKVAKDDSVVEGGTGEMGKQEISEEIKENEKKKILVICQYYKPEPFRISDICEELVHRGHVYAKDEKQTRYNVEMQVERKPALGKRSRYYQSQMDMEMLLTGEDYTELPNTYVIFICDFDPFGKDKYRYTFRTTCQESENVDLEDGRTTVFLNTRGKNESEVPGELVTFLQYMKEDLEGSEKEFHDPYVEQLQKFIRNVKGSREMEERFMIFEEMLKEERAAGFAKGRAEGVAEGRISESKDTLLLFLQNLGTVPKVLSDQIEEQGDLDVLKEWIRMAFQSKSVEEFAKKIK